MIIPLLLITSIFATSAMTAFSYAVSNLFSKQFREPVLLKEVLESLTFGKKLKNLNLSSWILHYFIGVLFNVVYFILWISKIIFPTLLTGGILGFISGIIAIICWKLMLDFADIHNKNRDTWYYVQLLIAHIIFGFISVIVFNWLS